MRLTTLLRLHLCCAALTAAAAPAFAQDRAAIAAPGGETVAVRVVAASAAKRATNLQRPPIAINFAGSVTLQDRGVPGGRAMLAATNLSRPSQN